MIDKISEAIYREFENRPRYAQKQMNVLLAQDLTIAALKAMRPHQLFDLPEAVALAGENAIDHHGRGSYTAAHDVFAAMIDALLAEADRVSRRQNNSVDR